MKREQVEEIIECLDNKSNFTYFKDRYCLDLLGYEIDRINNENRSLGDVTAYDKNREITKRVSVKTLKKGRFGAFLNKSIVQQGLSRFGDGSLDASDLRYFWPQDVIPFVTTLTHWGNKERGWDQTSRNQSNLVLQINFDSGHLSKYKKLVKPSDDYGPFEYWSHPVHQKGKKTLAWVRMDVDFSTDTVLIEEVQNDWLRKAERILLFVKKRLAIDPTTPLHRINGDLSGSYDQLRFYVEEVLLPYKKLWAEVSLTAAVDFIRETLGVRNIYYHSFETGMKIKKVPGKPPRSMYTSLPKKFGFSLTDETPEFLLRDKHAKRYIKAINEPRWFYLRLPSVCPSL